MNVEKLFQLVAKGRAEYKSLSEKQGLVIWTETRSQTVTPEDWEAAESEYYDTDSALAEIEALEAENKAEAESLAEQRKELESRKPPRKQKK